MDQRARMWKTLACLAVAMTSTTILLGWMDPSPPPPSASPSPDQLAQLARLAVDMGIDLREHRWIDIEVIEGPVAAAGTTLIAASRRESECHFRIDGNGRLFRTARWRDQRPPSASPHSVRIQVARTPGREPISLAQEKAIRALVDALDKALAVQEALLPVHLPPGWDGVLGAEDGVAIVASQASSAH